MPEYNQLVKLTPLGNYFFGGENFAARGDTAFYLQESEPFPQQTTLLGMLRYQHLLQNGYLTWQNGRQSLVAGNGPLLLAGGESFHPEDDRMFGNILHISPVFILDAEDRAYLPFPRVLRQTPEGFAHETPTLLPPQPGKGWLMQTQTLSPLSLFESYDPKLGFSWGYKALDSDRWLSRDDIFEDVPAQVGINKTHTLPHRRQEEQAEQEGFFKLTYCRLKEGFAFGVYLQLDDPAKLSSCAMTPFGKEQSPFKMEIFPVEAPTNWEISVPEVEAGQCLWLTAPCRIEATEIAAVSKAMIGQQRSFRCMVSELKTDYNYYGNPRSQQPGQPQISARYNLLDRGTLIWLRDDLTSAEAKTLSGAFSRYPAFTRIGYNHVSIL